MGALDEIQEAVARAAEQVGPSVVGLGNHWRRGSGVIVAQGKILTNGQVRILSTHEQRLYQNNDYLGANYPADHRYRKTLEAMTRKVGEKLAEKLRREGCGCWEKAR